MKSSKSKAYQVEVVAPQSVSGGCQRRYAGGLRVVVFCLPPAAAWAVV